MDINNLPNNLIKALEQKNTEQLVALARVLNLAVGKLTQATVVNVTPVTPAEREVLLKQTAAALAQINKQIKNPEQIPPNLKAEIQRLMDQQQLIKSPDLKWANIVVNNRPLLTYTDKPLTQGQAIPVQLSGQNKLVLLDLPEQNPISKPLAELTSNLKQPSTTLSPETVLAKLTGAQNKASTIAPALPPNEMPKTNTETPNTLALATTKLIAKENVTPSNTTSEIINGQKIASPDTMKALASSQTIARQLQASPQQTEVQPKQIIANELRQLLPQQNVPTHFYNAVTLWQAIPQHIKQELVPPSLEQALKSVAEKIRSPLELSQPKVLSTAIKNSGVFFESKLHENSQSTLKNEVVDSAKIPNTKQEISKIFSQDMKGSLLTVLNNVTKALANEKGINTSHLLSPPLLKDQLLSLFNNSDTDTLTTDLYALLKQLGTKPNQGTNDKEVRIKLLTFLQQHSFHSLSKIQLQQLHTLNHTIENKESLQPSNSWQLELPIKHQGDIHPLHLQIDREWVDEKSHQKESKTDVKKTKQWSVTLRFDLPSLGEFCAQMAIVDTNVSATLWATKESTLDRVRKKMEWLREQLEHEGIHVKQLQCLQGMPPLKPIKLSYSLIDVST